LLIDISVDYYVGQSVKLKLS